eukprot:767768-Amphidinium_carterae.1
MAEKLMEMAHAATLSDAVRCALRMNDVQSLQKAMALVREHCPQLLSWWLMLKGLKLLKRARREKTLLPTTRSISARERARKTAAFDQKLADFPAIDIDDVGLNLASEVVHLVGVPTCLMHIIMYLKGFQSFEAL